MKKAFKHYTVQDKILFGQLISQLHRLKPFLCFQETKTGK